MPRVRSDLVKGAVALVLTIGRCLGAMGVERWLFPLFSISFVSVLLFLSAISGFSASSAVFSSRIITPTDGISGVGVGNLPAFAYFISGGRDEGRSVLRLLAAVYHPRNRYLLHLSYEADAKERHDLVAGVRAAIPAARDFGNVDVLGKGDAMTYMGSSGLAATLHAAAVLLKSDGGWNWFVTLNAADYPLLTQDDLIHVFSSVPRDISFIEHTSDLGWKESQRVQPIIVDPGIYLARRTQIFHASEKRDTPDAFKFFTGSPWVILSRSFIEYCILGWDNLPRTLLLYFTNVLLSQEGYFHSVICNAPDFQNKTVKSDMRYMVWDNPPRMEPHFLSSSHYGEMSESGLPFARQFQKDDPVLDMIDGKILGRHYHRAVPGAWCSGSKKWWFDPCTQWKNANIVRPGPQAEKFGDFMQNLLDEWKSQSNTCK